MPRILWLLFASSACAAAEPTGDATMGAQLFAQYACYSCHGYHGAGGTGNPPLSTATSGILASERAFLTYLRLRADVTPVNPSRSMPHYSRESLSDQKALDIYAYLASLDSDVPPLQELPVLVEILEDAEERTE